MTEETLEKELILIASLRELWQNEQEDLERFINEVLEEELL